MGILVVAALVLAGSAGGAAELRGAAGHAGNKPAAHRGILARIAGGKTINIACKGAGSPTVILTAGLGGSSADWSAVQPELAKTTRVCAWDRLGSGFSSKSTGRETAAETTADLMAALKAARVNGAYVVVGHSLGSYESLLFKDRAPEAVVGIVLVDPSIPDQGDRLNKAGNKPPLSGKALLNPLYVSSKQVTDPKRNYGDMPVIVLTSTQVPELPPGTPDAVSVRATFAAMDAEMHRGHAELAGLSSRGVQRLVPDSGHYIQNDQPEAVIRAIREVVSAARESAAK